MPKISFNPSTDVPSLDEKVVLITGGTAGLGRETVLSFAAHNASHIFFTGRSQSSASSLLDEVTLKYPNTPITFIPYDLASLSAVQKAARKFISKSDRLGILMANAGIMATAPGLTEDGYEVQFGTNHVGHALLVKLLTPLLEATAAKTAGGGDVRIIWNTSQGYGTHPSGGIVFPKLKTTQTDIFFIAQPWVRYGQSKLANILYARTYASHHPRITSVPIHPGVSYTGLVSGLDFWSWLLVNITTWRIAISAEECAWNQQWAAKAPVGTGRGEVKSGAYYEPVGAETKLIREGGNDDLAERLWEWTEKELEGWTL